MSIEKQNYTSFLSEVKEKIYASQYRALKAVNKELIKLYWEIGRALTEKQEQMGWGKSVVETLSKDLQAEMPGVNGFSASNLWRMKSFYDHYQANEKLAPLVREIGWSHNLVILEKCKNDLEREFYIKMTKKYGWSKSVLIHQVEGKAYERFLLNQTKLTNRLPKNISTRQSWL